MPTTFSPDPARVFAFLKRWPIYQPTPVRDFKTAAGTLFVKDETARMGLGAFKALGGPFAVARLLEDRWTEVMKTPAPADGKLRDFAKDITFVCASAGNHGLAVAAGARHAGARAHPFGRDGAAGVRRQAGSARRERCALRRYLWRERRGGHARCGRDQRHPAGRRLMARLSPAARAGHGRLYRDG